MAPVYGAPQRLPPLWQVACPPDRSFQLSSRRSAILPGGSIFIRAAASSMAKAVEADADLRNRGGVFLRDLEVPLTDLARSTKSLSRLVAGEAVYGG